MWILTVLVAQQVYRHITICFDIKWPYKVYCHTEERGCSIHPKIWQLQLMLKNGMTFPQISNKVHNSTLTLHNPVFGSYLC